ncbi:hypothetical protein COBT_000086 [Conglomerata obtusa]
MIKKSYAGQAYIYASYVANRSSNFENMVYRGPSRHQRIKARRKKALEEVHSNRVSSSNYQESSELSETSCGLVELFSSCCRSKKANNFTMQNDFKLNPIFPRTSKEDWNAISAYTDVHFANNDKIYQARVEQNPTKSGLRRNATYHNKSTQTDSSCYSKNDNSGGDDRFDNINAFDTSAEGSKCRRRGINHG